MGVAAFSDEHLQEMATLIADPNQPPNLRLVLIGMLRDPKFAGDARANGILVDVIRTGESTTLTAHALAALRATGEPDVADNRKDDRNAWATRGADGGAEWLELTYETLIPVVETATALLPQPPLRDERQEDRRGRILLPAKLGVEVLGDAQPDVEADEVGEH
jgi:hypothetical protein